METHHQSFDFELKSLTAIRRWVECCTDGIAKTKPVQQLNAAIDELCANIILYRKEADIDSKIDIGLNVSSACISAEIVSHGEEFNITAYTPKSLDTLMDNRIKGGLGIRIIQMVTDKLEYSHWDHMNRYLLVKNLD